MFSRSFQQNLQESFWTGHAFMETETIYVHEFRRKRLQYHGNACFMYCSLIDTWFSTTRRSKFKSLERRVRSIIFQDENPSKLKVKISAMGDCQMRKFCTLTFRCMKKKCKLTRLLLGGSDYNHIVLVEDLADAPIP
jgi:hypothetical protein